MDSQIIIQQLFNGLAQGCTYSLIAIGYALIFSSLRKMNFSHSDVCMIGAMLAYTVLGLVVKVTDNIILLILIGMLVGMLSSACVGFIIEKVAFKPLRFAPSMANSLCTIGFGYLLKEIARLTWGGQNQRFIPSFDWNTSFKFPSINLTVSKMQLLMFAISILLILILQLFLYKTNTGRAIRAISMNSTAAQLMGISLDRITSITFMISSALSGAAGVLIGLYLHNVSPYMGSAPGIKAFAAIVLGGLSSIPGAAIGGLFLGLSETLGSMILGDQWKDGIAYLLFFIVLIIRPQGLLGGSKKEGR